MIKHIELFTFIIIFIYSIIICIFNKFNKVKFIHFISNKKDSIDKIYKSISLDINTVLNTKHYWNEDINNNLKKEILKINDDILDKLEEGYKYIPSMTELYYSSKENQNSDKQYVSNHTDGPFYGCNLYRALVIINGNKNIDTYFPDENKVINLKKYDIVLFDYDNEFHYINVNNSEYDDSQRIIIKLHYVKSNNRICEKIHCEFGRQTRDLFELNKEKLHLSGVISRSSLYYNTYRKYILIFIFIILLLYYFKKKNKLLHRIIRCILYIFVIIEVSGIIYTLHFNLLKRKVCE